MTKISVSTKNSSRTKEFSEFRVGEFLIAERTRFLGIKISPSSILYFGNAAGGTENAIATEIVRFKLFDVPHAVDITVTR